MTATHYLGFTKAGAPIGRKSQNEYGYTHAAVKLRNDGSPERGLANFSTSAEGARRNLGSWWINKGYPFEIVKVEIVDGATYRKAMAKGK